MAEQLSAVFLKKFVKNICLTVKKHEQAETSRDELKNQIRKVKQVSLYTDKKWLLDREIKVLEKKIDEVLKNELALMSISRAGNFELKELKRNISSLQEKFEKELRELPSHYTSEPVKEMLSDVKEKLGTLVGSRIERERKISEMEHSMIRKGLLRRSALEIERRLMALEEKYQKLMQVSPELAQAIGSRINSLKSRIENLH